MHKFSILTSAYVSHELKVKQLLRCVNSVKNQSFENWEMIVVDDGSPIAIEDFGDPRVKVVKQEHLERVVALRKAMTEATGEWLAFLDADDEYFSYSLECMAQITKKNPEYNMFNCASLHVRKDYGAGIRGGFQPKAEGEGHEVFGGGNIVNGTFFFHRKIYEKHGGYPNHVKKIDTTEINYGGVRPLSMCNPYDFSAYAQLKFPEIRQFFFVDKENEPNKVIRELGNPWGNDYFLFYKYTRKYQSKPYDIPIIIIHHEGKTEGEGHDVK